MSTRSLRSFVRELGRLDDAVTDAERIDQIRLLEELKSAAAAAQAKVVSDFRRSQEADQRARGVPASAVGRGVASQVALAKRESAARARRYLGWSEVLVTELPKTFAALQAGRITEWRAQIVARETAWLSLEHRQEIDRGLAPHLEEWGDRRVEAEVKKHAYRLDPRGFLARISQAENDRRVSVRPAPDCMSSFRGLVPMAQGVAMFAALKHAADSLVAQGDDRSRGQIMADTLVERVTGQASASAVPARIELVMTDQTFFNTGAGSDEPAHVIGYGADPGRARPTTRERSGAARPRRSCDGCTPTAVVGWSRWSRRVAGSRERSPTSSSSATRCAGLRGATRQSGTATTSSRWTRAA